MTVRLSAVLLLLLSAAAHAQLESGSTEIARRVRIRIEFEDHGACNSSTRVELTGSMGFAVAEGAVSGECVAEFFDVPAGRYRVTVRGADVANADEGEIEISSAITQDLQVWAKHKQASDPVQAAGAPSIISVADLKMPSGAAKEFGKAERLLQKQDWQKASDHMRKGLAEYSTYAAGYNNLGAVYVRMGDVRQAREAFQKAVELDERLAPAYVNLARVSFMEKDYPGAESLLQKAIGIKPAENADEFILLAYAELIDKHWNDAIQTSQQGHAMKLKQHAFLHLAAAHALEQQTKIADCIQELRLYISEEPTGPQSEKVKSAITTLQTQVAVR